MPLPKLGANLWAELEMKREEGFLASRGCVGLEAGGT